MKLDKSKVYTLEGMTEAQVEKLFKDNETGLYSALVGNCGDGVANSDDLIYYKNDTDGWCWCFDYEPELVVFALDLINE